MSDITDLMKRYHGYILKRTEAAIPSSDLSLGWGADVLVVQDGGLLALPQMDKPFSSIQYTACFEPGLTYQEELRMRGHIEELFVGSNLVVLNQVGNAPRPVKSAGMFDTLINVSQDVRRTSKRVFRESSEYLIKKSGEKFGEAKISFYVLSQDEKLCCSVVDAVHKNLAEPNKEFVSDEIRKIYVKKCEV